MTRLVALHLPQFHRIPENDQWWGPGFTEWTLVRKATPRFRGHVQPRHPAELGYYNLSDEGTFERSRADWPRGSASTPSASTTIGFGGEQLLEQPVQGQMLSTGRPDFPFLLCWANENWTRAFDGRTRETLVAQTYPILDAQEHAQLSPPTSPTHVT